MTDDDVDELFSLLASEIFGSGRVDALSEQSYRRWRSVWARPLEREQMHRACGGFEALLKRLMDFELLDAGPALTQLCALAMTLRLDAVALTDSIYERARRAERSLGTERPRPRGDELEGSPAWMIRCSR
jgi:hypothetical protein